MALGLDEKLFGLLMASGSCLYGIANPRISEAINKSVDPTRRATVLSTQTTLVSLLFIPVSGVAGEISTAYGVRGVLAAIACWLGIAGVSLAAWQAQKKKSR